jgi:hypothetical protein
MSSFKFDFLPFGSSEVQSGSGWVEAKVNSGGSSGDSESVSLPFPAPRDPLHSSAHGQYLKSLQILASVITSLTTN